ncbi:hypothetical protein [Aeromicrobium chenweiae]|uniref:Uncharacterized protein n=1 Tax=Aeromicrobium chenweiae TaxID=2079793 RepID=A0A2S0WPS0_9ACTN|nr:hypothetical protein [Aeromicrobium chenweiae]AWB93280.1 hypothetical protein C3E78_14275 [Aeromicrobium chenweiae]TGN34273.1 hypothetical protein E4L97_04310 [Aeromicrobium chenweiae]
MKKLVLALTGLALATGGLVLSVGAADAERATGDPVISGSGRVGEKLTITSHGSLGGESGGYTYVWLWDGDEVPGPGDTGATHTVTQADLQAGKRLSVLVKPKSPRAERLRSNEIAPVGGSLAPPAVKIAGSPKVKGSLTASFTTPGTAGASVTSVWTRDGKVIAGASGRTYRLTTADAGRAIAFRTTSVKSGYTTRQSATSALRVPAYSARKPTVSGTFAVRKKVRVKDRGGWSGAGYSYSYRWLRNGKAIKGATKSSYKLTTKDRRKRVSVRVTAKKKGFASVSRTGKSRKVR